MGLTARELVFEGWDDLLVLHVLRNMRALDAEEIFATRPDSDPFALYRDMAALGGRHLWFELVRPADSMVPVALFGVVGTSPGNGQAHLVATDAFTLADARRVAARIRDLVIPAMLDIGLHRVEALSLDSHGWAHRFLRAAGATRVEPRPALGRRGEDFRALVWLDRDLTAPDADTPEPTPEAGPAAMPSTPRAPTTGE